MTALALLHPAVLAMAGHVAVARARRALGGHHRYEGDAAEILRQGLEACWNGEFLTASPGTYRQFWTRDTSFAAPALIRLGDPWPDRLVSSYAWALDAWRDRGTHVTTTVGPLLRHPVDLFHFGVDSLPLLFASLHALTRDADPAAAARAQAVVNEHADWLADEVTRYVDEVVDPATGLVRPDGVFSAHRDTFRNGSTAYANTMVALLGRTVADSGWGPDLLSRHFQGDWGSLLTRHFWLGDRFRDRIDADDTSGEANVWPFFTRVVADRKMLEAATWTLRREGFADPYPLRYDVDHRSEGQLGGFRLWASDYQTTAAWTSLGAIHVSLLGEVDADAARVERERMASLIERDGTFWEVLGTDGRAWRSQSRLSVSDQAMLWGAILLVALVDPAGPPLRIG